MVALSLRNVWGAGQGGHGRAARDATTAGLSQSAARSSCSAGNRQTSARSVPGAAAWLGKCGGVQPVSGKLCSLSLSTSGHVIAHPTQVEHHRWTAPVREPPGHGLTPLDDATLAKLRQMGWRAPPRHSRRTWMALIVALSLHAVFVAALWHLMQPVPGRAGAPSVDEVLRVRFITRTPVASLSLPTVPAAPPLPTRRPPPVKTREPASKDAMQIQPRPPTSARDVGPASLFDKDGQPLLPAAAASATTPDYVQRIPQGDSRVMQHNDLIKYKATRFENYFPPPDESVGGAAVRHVVDTVVGSKDVDLPRGIHLKCMTLLGIPIPNCINPPAPPSAKDGDERLNMAPAQSLDGVAHHPKPPSEKACIAIYREGKPLPWGCPVDTPNRAVDAELRARTRGAKSQP
jgi:hypothetical protein